MKTLRVIAVGIASFILYLVVQRVLPSRYAQYTQRVWAVAILLALALAVGLVWLMQQKGEAK